MVYVTKNNESKTKRRWWFATLSSIVGTVVGIILTFGVSAVIEHNNREKDRELTTKIIASNIHMRATNLEENILRIKERMPYIKRMLSLTPEQVDTMSEDSIMEYCSSLLMHKPLYNDFGRSLLNSNLDIVRSTDRYHFIYYAEYCYNTLDYIEYLYDKYGINTLSNHINDFLMKRAVEQKIVSDSPRWDLKEVVESDEMKLRINYFIDGYERPMEKSLGLIKGIKADLLKYSDISQAEMQQFLDEYTSFGNQ